MRMRKRTRTRLREVSLVWSGIVWYGLEMGADAETYVNWNSTRKNNNNNNKDGTNKRENSRKTDGSYKEFSFISNYAVWVSKWRRLAVSHNWRQGLRRGLGQELEPKLEMGRAWANWLGFCRQRTKIQFHAACHKDKGRQPQRQQKLQSRKRDDRQFTALCSQLPTPYSLHPTPSFQLLIPIPRWDAAGPAMSSSWHSKLCALRSKEFQISHFCLTTGIGRQIKIAGAIALSRKGCWRTRSSGGRETVDCRLADWHIPSDNLKSSANIERNNCCTKCTQNADK